MESNDRTVKVWDIGVRMFHWSLAGLFVIAWISAEELDLVHEMAGYTILALIGFRIFWGFVGPKHARFSSFLVSPAELSTHLKDLLRGNPGSHLGHNPAGGYMVVALLLALLLLSYTGITLEEGEKPAMVSAEVASMQGGTDVFDEHHFYGHEDEEHEEGHEAGEELHEALAYLALALVLVHLGGVALMSLMQRENLPRTMLTGRKRRRQEKE